MRSMLGVVNARWPVKETSAKPRSSAMIQMMLGRSACVCAACSDGSNAAPSPAAPPLCNSCRRVQVLHFGSLFQHLCRNDGFSQSTNSFLRKSSYGLVTRRDGFQFAGREYILDVAESIRGALLGHLHALLRAIAAVRDHDGCSCGQARCLAARQRDRWRGALADAFHQ